MELDPIPTIVYDKAPISFSWFVNPSKATGSISWMYIISSPGSLIDKFWGSNPTTIHTNTLDHHVYNIILTLQMLKQSYGNEWDYSNA